MPAKDHSVTEDSADADGRLRQLVYQGRLAMPTRKRPERTPRLVDTGPRASSLVLAERGHAALPDEPERPRYC
jgi:hypothetical protein